jgi:glycosyltransferase involved in cell wall biosynthesis
MEDKATSSAGNPRVSVIIPAYCASTYIAEAMQSVFNQTYQAFETIVINDGSPDTPQLEEVLRPYASRIRYLKQPNRGVSAARNCGIQNARGSLLAFLDSDDLWLPEYLDSQVSFLDQNPTAVAAVSDVIYFGDLAGDSNLQEWLRPGMAPLLSFEDMIRRKAGQLPSATVVRRENAIKCGLYDEQLRLGEDIEFSMRICFPDRMIGYTGRALAKYRRHGASAAGNLSTIGIAKNEAACLRHLGKRLPLAPQQRALVHQEIAALEAELAMMEAYKDLEEQKFPGAAAKLIEANKHYRDKRIAVAAFALRILPSLTARVLLSRKNSRQPTTGKP